ncbi:hypothetical protein GS03_00392 [Flavobacterium sangjuense]|uniref:Cardiolipin synthase N-terminal domain-containing protein n=1 Tax=Flavobacterium sangjuense TaxID=2518177 RepID=A0A4P7PQC2_9FLAO|nr:hypothetical protein GS03_00392 [Flavobacterium sangjuense]
MRLILPFFMTIIFVLYVLYLAFIKKDLKKNMQTVVYPGVFFISVWVICYFIFLY